MSNLFQSSAKASSVESNTIKVENAAEGILREGQATLKKMNRRFKAEEAAANRQVGYRQEKFKTEQADRKRTREWEMELSKGFIDAVKYNHKVEIDSATSAVKNAKQGLLGQLKEFSPTLNKIWDKVDEKREKEGKAFGKMLAFKYGITSQDYADAKTIRGALRENAGQNYALINKMKEGGAAWEDIEKASRLNGYQRLGLAEGTAVRAGQTYDAWAFQNSTTEYELGNGLGKKSLSQARASGNPRLLAAVQQKMLNVYLDQPHLKSLDQDLLITHAREPILRSQGRQVSLLVEKNRELIKENEERDYRQLLANNININGAAGYFDEIELKSGIKGENRAWAVAQSHQHLIQLFEEGALSKKHLFDIYDYEFMPGVKYGERNWRKIDDLMKAVNKYDMEQRTLAESQIAARETDNKLKTDLLERQIIDDYENVTNDELMGLYKEAAKIGNDPMMKMLQKRMTTSVTKINDITNVPHLEMLLSNNMLTKEAVANAGLSPSVNVEWMKKAKDNNPFTPPDDIDKLFETTGKRAIEQILQTFGVESKYILSSSLAATTAHNDMRRYYKMGLMESNGNQIAARDIAIKMFQDDLKSEKYHVTERTMVNGTMTQNPHFTKFHLKPERIAYPVSEFTTEMVRQNPNIWQEKLMVPEQEVRQFLQDLQSGRVKNFPPTALHLANKYNWDVLKLLDAQGQLIDKNLKIDDKWFAVSDEANSRIRPEFQPMLKEGKMGVITSMVYSGLNPPDYELPEETPGETNIYRRYLSPAARNIYETIGAWQ